MMGDVYQLDGTERIEKEITEIDCGKCVKTSYFNADGVMVRSDVNIEVSEEFLAKSGIYGTGGK